VVDDGLGSEPDVGPKFSDPPMAIIFKPAIELAFHDKIGRDWPLDRRGALVRKIDVGTHDRRMAAIVHHMNTRIDEGVKQLALPVLQGSADALSLGNVESLYFGAPLITDFSNNEGSIHAVEIGNAFATSLVNHVAQIIEHLLQLNRDGHYFRS